MNVYINEQQAHNNALDCCQLLRILQLQLLLLRVLHSRSNNEGAQSTQTHGFVAYSPLNQGGVAGYNYVEITMALLPSPGRKAQAPGA